jgi:hypothetical protein
MNRKTALSAVLLCFLDTGVALAQVSENSDLSWDVIVGGGGPAGSADYMMGSTAGQAAVGYAGPMSHTALCGRYQLRPDRWCEAAA